MQVKRTFLALTVYVEFKCKYAKINKCNKIILIKIFNNSDFLHFFEKNSQLSIYCNKNKFKKIKIMSSN